MALSDRAAAFFDSYVAAFERFDAAAIAAHFAFPCHMTSETGAEPDLRSIPDEEGWRADIEGLVGFYRSAGVATARMLEASSTPVSGAVEQAAIHWRLEDAAGAEVYDFHAVYTLVERDGLRIAALAHDELPRVQAFLQR